MEMAHQRSLAPVLDRLPLAWFAALLSVGAAGVHFAVAPEHFAEYWFFGWFFVVVAWLQAVWAVVATSRPSRGVFISAIVGNLVLAGIWLWTRVVSLPIGPNAGHAEAVGWSDTLTVVLQAGVVGLCLLSSGRTTRRPELSGVLVLVLGSLALIAATGFVLSADADRSGGTGAVNAPSMSQGVVGVPVIAPSWMTLTWRVQHPLPRERVIGLTVRGELLRSL